MRLIKKIGQDWNYYLFFLIGFILRLIIARIDYYRADLDFFFIRWSEQIFYPGFSGFYDIWTKKGAIYPPLTIYSLSIMNVLYRTIDAVLWKLNLVLPFFPSKIIFFWHDPLMLPAMMKLPAIIAEVLLAILIFKIFKKDTDNKVWPWLASGLILFNPALIFVSAFWGQIDIIPVYFFALSIYFLSSKRYYPSVISFCLSLLFKQTAIIFVPIYLLILIINTNYKQKIISIIIFLGLFWFAFLPFFKKGNIFLFPFITYFNISTTFGSSFLTTNAFNFWRLITGPNFMLESDMSIFGIPAFIFSRSIIAIILILLLVSLRKKQKDSVGNIAMICAIFAMYFFTFSTQMHERHLLPVLPLLVIALSRFRHLLPLFIFATLYHWLNLYNAWKNPRIELIVSMINNEVILKILIMIFITVLIYLLYTWKISGDKLAASKIKIFKMRDRRDLNP